MNKQKNVMYYEKAKEAAKTAVENLVKEFNPDVVGLNVEVEFFEESHYN